MSATDYDNNDVKIITKPLKSKNPILIEGFPGIGLVGNIASQHMIEELNMEYIGSIDSRYFPSIAVLYEGLINMPVRIYEKEESEPDHRNFRYPYQSLSLLRCQ